jgi:hypothetical protein
MPAIVVALAVGNANVNPFPRINAPAIIIQSKKLDLFFNN